MCVSINSIDITLILNEMFRVRDIVIIPDIINENKHWNIHDLAAAGHLKMQSLHSTVSTNETVLSWMECTAALMASARGIRGFVLISRLRFTILRLNNWKCERACRGIPTDHQNMITMAGDKIVSANCRVATNSRFVFGISSPRVIFFFIYFDV